MYKKEGSLFHAYIISEQTHRKNFMFTRNTIKVNIFDFVILVNNLH